MAKYREVKEGSRLTDVVRSGRAYIPRDERNRDYREFLLWLDGFDADGNDLGTGKNVPDAATTAGGKY